MTLVKPGVCRHCGCSPEDPCSLCRQSWGDAAFTNMQRLVCQAAPCVRAEQARIERNKEAAREARADGLAAAGLRGRKGCAA